jgi:hypothetical protein
VTRVRTDMLVIRRRIVRIMNCAALQAGARPAALFTHRKWRLNG